MLENFRQSEARDALGQIWQVRFLWVQNAISIRHSDSVDVKFALTCGSQQSEKVISLNHPQLLEAARKAGRPLTDAWCCRLAADHLGRLIATGEDMEKALVTVEDLDGSLK